MTIIVCFPSGHKPESFQCSELTAVYNSSAIHDRALSYVASRGYACTGDTSIEMNSREVIVYVY